MKDTHKKIKKAWILLHNDIFIFYHFLNRIFIENCSSSCCKMCSKMRSTCNVCKMSLQWSINTFSSLLNSMLISQDTRRVLIRAVLRAPRGLFQQHAAPSANQDSSQRRLCHGNRFSSDRTAPAQGKLHPAQVQTWDPFQHCEPLKDSPLSPSLGHTSEPPLHPHPPPSPFTGSSSSQAVSALLSAYLKFKITTRWKHKAPLHCLLS